MDLIALNAAIEAYEADLCRPTRGRGMCIEIRASARNAAIEAFKAHQSPASLAQDSKSEGLLAAAEHHEYLAQAWHDSATYLASRPKGIYWEQALEDSVRSLKRVPIHKALAREFRDMAAGKHIIHELPLPL